MITKHLSTLLLFPVAALLLTSASFAQKKGPPAPVEVAKVNVMEIAPVMAVSGTVISRDDAQLSAEVSGRVIWMADVGQYLAKGEAATKIDDRRLQLQKLEAESKVKAARTRINFLKKESARLKKMAKNQHTSQTVLEQTLRDYAVSEADLQAAEAQLGLIEDDISKTQIIAPFNGYITERHKMTGEQVRVGEEVVHLVGIENIEIEASAPLVYVRYVKKGSELMVKSREHDERAKISSLVSIGTGQSRQFVMRLTLPQRDDTQQKWIPGMAVRVLVPTQDRESRLVIPRDAMVIRRDGIYVYRVKDDSTVEKVQVTTGAAEGDFIAVEGALNTGDTVVIRGNERLRPGQKVSTNTQKP